MNQLTKAQFTISFLACFSLGWGLIKEAVSTQLYLESIGIVALQFLAIVIITFVLLSILKWVDVFDLKTNAVITFITVLTLGLTLII